MTNLKKDFGKAPLWIFLSYFGPHWRLFALAVMFTIRRELALVLTVILPPCLWFTARQRVKMKQAGVEQGTHAELMARNGAYAALQRAHKGAT